MKLQHLAHICYLNITLFVVHGSENIGIFSGCNCRRRAPVNHVWWPSATMHPCVSQTSELARSYNMKALGLNAGGINRYF